MRGSFVAPLAGCNFLLGRIPVVSRGALNHRLMVCDPWRGRRVLDGRGGLVLQPAELRVTAVSRGDLRGGEAVAGGGALDLADALLVVEDLGFVAGGIEGGGEDLLEAGRLFFEGVVHPFALAAGFDEAGAAEVGEVA